MQGSRYCPIIDDLDVAQEFKGWSAFFDNLDALLRQITNCKNLKADQPP